MNLIILEGPRTVGKSTLSQLLRQQVNYCTLVNFTGFSEDGAEGLNKITKYYGEWLSMFANLRGSDITFVCDRSFFSEMVYSQLCKSYDFRPYYEHFVSTMGMNCDSVKVFHLNVKDEEEIKKRAIREKVKFKDVGDSVDEVLKQKELYDSLFAEFKAIKPLNTELHEIDTTNKTIEQVKNEIIDLLD